MFLSLLNYLDRIGCDYPAKIIPPKEPVHSDLLLVYCLLDGDDHDGYCSGEEADIHQEEIIKLIETSEFNPQDFDSNDWLKLPMLHKLDKYHEGCTSESGSGYCSGFYQLQKATKAHKIRIEKL